MIKTTYSVGGLPPPSLASAIPASAKAAPETNTRGRHQRTLLTVPKLIELGG